jgi:hypothetical protein
MHVIGMTFNADMKDVNEQQHHTGCGRPMHGTAVRRLSVCAVVLVAVLFAAASSYADEVYRKNSRGNELYKKGKADEALKQYDDALLIAPNDTLLRMNRGSALYRMGRYDEAESMYTPATALKNKSKQADAHYNLGNILFREGDALMQSGGQGADEKYKAALQHYITSLDLRSGDKATKWNVELARKRIQQAQQQQQKNQNKQNQQDQNNKNQNKKDQDKKNQDKNKNDQNKNDKNKNDKNKNDQNKKDQDKNKQDQNKNDQNKDKKDQDKKNQDQNGNRNQNPNSNQPKPSAGKEDMKKDEAKRIVAQFADDADSLNRPPKKARAFMAKRPEKDW